MKDTIPFLKQVARKYYAAGGIEGRCFIFPNRRSMVFFRKYLAEEVSQNGSAPILMPQMMSQNDFFCAVGGMRPADRITLLIELYDCYKELNSKAESLDDFIFWGDVLLGDFNDVDKYLVDTHRLYANVSDLKAIQDSFSYLTEEQRKAMERFIAHFDRIGAGSERKSATDGADDTDGASGKRNVKEDFMQIWNILEPLYESFNARLRSEGKAYEGMIYRSVAERLRDEAVVDVLRDAFGTAAGSDGNSRNLGSDDGCDGGLPIFVFVGLNALNECEKLVMRRMRDAGVAQFCWDYSGDMITDPLNKSSFFMADNVKEFPQAFDFDEVGDHKPEVTVISVPSGVGQVKIVPDLIRGREDCAVVLPDEQLLMPLLNTIPPEIGEINVTMGRSMSSSVFHSLMCSVAALQLYMRQRGGEWAFYHRAVREIFSNGIFARALDAEGREAVAAIRKAARIYVSQSDFKGCLLERVFRPVVMDPKATDQEQIRRFAEYLMDVVVAIVDGLQGTDGGADDMILGFAKTWYCEMNRLASKQLSILPATWIRLMKRVMDPVSVPFRGEPLRGLQIMGPLETRTLDFTNLVILSANESVFPGRNISSSFIPPELRRSFGLPTYEFQDAVWAYYFYRMISRAKTVTLVYDSRTEGLHTGEESRYIKQLAMHFNVPVRRMVAGVAIGRQEEQGDIVKTPEDIAKLRDVTFSATTVRNYLSCPAKFYYSKIRELAPESEISETLDQRTVGTVFHAAMQALYSGGDSMTPDGKPRKQMTYHGPGEPTWIITRDYLKAWRGRPDAIREKVGRLVMDELGVPEISGRDLVTIDVIVSYIKKAIDRDLEYLKANGADHFTVCGLELPVGLDREDIRFEGYKFYGLIDRLDSLAPGTVRVCDYKTGRVLDEDLDINADNAQERADAVFAPESKNRPEIALQVFIYDMLLKRNGCRDRISNTIYQTSGLFGAPVKEIPYCGTFYKAMEEGLRGLMSEIADPAVPFRRTEDRRTCEYCDFKMICGR